RDSPKEDLATRSPTFWRLSPASSKPMTGSASWLLASTCTVPPPTSLSPVPTHRAYWPATSLLPYPRRVANSCGSCNGVPDEVITHSEEETMNWGREFAARLHAPLLVLLTGELGSGKTTLTK